MPNVGTTVLGEVFHPRSKLAGYSTEISLILSMEQYADFKEVETQFIVTIKKVSS